jgi:tetratricopeptide (TPR) repeat protein
MEVPAFEDERLQEYQLPHIDATPSTTQLADTFPQIDSALRVEPPASFKAPRRKDGLSKDKQIRDSSFSPGALCAMRQPMDEGFRLFQTCAHSESRLKEAPQNHTPSKNAVADANLLAISSQRAGKVQMEGQSYLSMAIALDNAENYVAAMESYRKLLAVCKKVGDLVVESFAHNCLGVDAMLLASPPSEGSQFEARNELSEDSKSMINKAIEYHKMCVEKMHSSDNRLGFLTHRHLETADEGGLFVARTNLGLCFNLLGDFEGSTQHHQEALKMAIQLQVFKLDFADFFNHGESPLLAFVCIQKYDDSLIVGKASRLEILLSSRCARSTLSPPRGPDIIHNGPDQGEFPTAKACLEQHLQLVQSLKDSAGELNCWIKVATTTLFLGAAS